MAKKTTNPTKSLKIPAIIIISAKICAFISTKLVTRFAAKIFTTPIKHKVPKREFEMDSKSIKKNIYVPSIDKSIVTYFYGQSDRKILLVHGWSGRGTQLFKIADELLRNGYSTVSFDAPAHGKSEGKTTIMSEFIASILEIEKQFGPFEIAIGHSLGGMSVLNSIKDGLSVEKAIIIGSGDIVQDILDEFVFKLGLKKEISKNLRDFFEKKYEVKMDDFSAYRAAKKIEIPVLVIHDNDDPEVSVKAGIHITENLKKGTQFLTDGLGHRKILGNQNVIKKILEFIKGAN
ncbi:pimeloyl-ACP methyl ester carboxylesterase [Flavobacterium nitrogenifigens]|uniref:Pimeloyl-ACP methyl ester carboxylesterase n=2 Tax=Flavobacterium TaxID=237 RepID=A0A7W7J1K3_9FLAO|nr:MULTISPECIES: alpha/beta hydrolase [Flavobacterium]MBB4804087.1 pimeloyl-ACP methyl ester carboxylesterase [Flavobacterium nitrogenifigens]MBB6388760.1 pimeloyl-ACP methyl ester carboxylesterase [Flavobacterium notoginsengisoli]